jgi:proteasome lid subunit RPN8/RPN11
VFIPPVKPLREFFPQVNLDIPMPEQAPFIFIDRGASRAMWTEARRDTSREVGGILAGEPYQDPAGRYFVIVRRAVHATDTAGTSTHLQFHSESWHPVWRLLHAHPKLKVVGWYHTHPRMSVFFSRTDRRTQRNHFSQPWQIAVVLDPVGGQIAYYYGGEAEKAPHVQGFRLRRIPRRVAKMISEEEGRA